MCAIHGIVDVKPELMMKMVKAAHHRGPDGNGIFEDDYITLGHNLLSIVGQVKDGKQPYHFEDCLHASQEKLLHQAKSHHCSSQSRRAGVARNEENHVLL